MSTRTNELLGKTKIEALQERLDEKNQSHESFPQMSSTHQSSGRRPINCKRF